MRTSRLQNHLIDVVCLTPVASCCDPEHCSTIHHLCAPCVAGSLLAVVAREVVLSCKEADAITSKSRVLTGASVAMKTRDALEGLCLPCGGVSTTGSGGGFDPGEDAAAASALVPLAQEQGEHPGQNVRTT